MSEKYEILRRIPGSNISGILPDEALPIGLAMRISDMDPTTEARTFAKAEGYADGFLTRAVRTTDSGDRPATIGNPRTDSEILWNEGVETPFLAGREGTIERAEALAVMGADYLMTSGSAAIDENTAEDTELSFTQGRFCVAAEGDYAQFLLKKQLDFDQIDENDGPRIYVELLKGYKVPAA